MLNGRIDLQGTTEELRDYGALDAILAEGGISEHREDVQMAHVEDEQVPETIHTEAEAGGDAKSALTRRKSKKPHKFVKDEERETGGVKWKIYRTYLEAS